MTPEDSKSLEDELRDEMEKRKQQREQQREAEKERRDIMDAMTTVRPKAPGPTPWPKAQIPGTALGGNIAPAPPPPRPTLSSTQESLDRLLQRLRGVESTAEIHADAFAGRQPKNAGSENVEQRAPDGVFDQLSTALDVAHAIVDNIQRNMNRTQSAIE